MFNYKYYTSIVAFASYIS